MHYWFRSYGNFAEWIDFAYWWSFSAGGSAIDGATPSNLKTEYYTLVTLDTSQPALAGIGNIAFSLSKTKGKIRNSPFTGDEFTWRPSVAQK